MSNFENSVQRGLHDLASQVDAAAEDRVIGRLERVRATRRRSAVAAMGLGVAAAVAVVAAVTTLGQTGGIDPRETPAAGDGGVQTAVVPGDSIELAPEIGVPCPQATHATTLAGVLALTEVPIYPPTQGQLTDAWTCADTPVLMYDGAIHISYEEGWGDVNVAQKWADLVRDNGGRTVTVLDRPAYVHPPTPEGPRSGVFVVVDGTLVRLLAEGDVPVEKLISLAESMQVT